MSTKIQKIQITKNYGIQFCLVTPAVKYGFCFHIDLLKTDKDPFGWSNTMLPTRNIFNITVGLGKGAFGYKRSFLDIRIG